MKTKSGAPVTTCTSCPARISCRATYTHITIASHSNFTSIPKFHQCILQIYTRKFRIISTIKTKQCDQASNRFNKSMAKLIRELWIENSNLDNTSGMAEAMASNVVSENQVISGRRYSIILFVNPHFFFFFGFRFFVPQMIAFSKIIIEGESRDKYRKERGRSSKYRQSFWVETK